MFNFKNDILILEIHILKNIIISRNIFLHVHLVKESSHRVFGDHLLHKMELRGVVIII